MKEPTASPDTVLLHGHSGLVWDPDANRSPGLRPAVPIPSVRTRTGRRGGSVRRRGLQGRFLFGWTLPIERHKGLVEFARCRSDLSLRLLAIACYVMDSLLAQVVAADAAGAPADSERAAPVVCRSCQTAIRRSTHSVIRPFTRDDETL